MYPKISAVMPFYNREKYLAESIDSVLNQSFKNFELILVNDGSIDESLSIAQKYAQKDSRITIISYADNRGISYARNEGAKKARADLIAIVDSDDINMPERFKMQYDAFCKYLEIDIIGGAAECIDGSGELTSSKIAYHENYDDIAKTFLHYGPFLQPTVMVRKASFFDVGGYRNEHVMAEDLDLFCRILASGRKGLNLPQTLIQYRQHKESTGAHTLEKRKIVYELKKKVIKEYDIQLSLQDYLYLYVWDRLWYIFPEKVMLHFEVVIKNYLYCHASKS